jgi:hypothetical protein
MAIETLDRTLWSYSEARDHVQNMTVAQRVQAAAGKPPVITPINHWERPRDPVTVWKGEAEEQLLVALRDGDLLAQGRFSETRNNSSFGPDSHKTWILHSGYHQHVTPVQWREGQFMYGTLSTMFWEFIDIRLPRFTVKGIWPDYLPPVTTSTMFAATQKPYTTPYLELMQAAIVHFGISAERQEKKDCLVDWFLTQHIEGEPVSRNLADAMATLIRLPAAQRGGSKRVSGPDLRKLE